MFSELIAFVYNFFGIYSTLIVITILYIILSGITLIAFNLIQHKVTKTNTLIDDYLFKTLSLPLKLAILVLGIYIISSELHTIHSFAISQVILTHFESIVLVFLIITIFSVIANIQKYFLNQKYAHADTILLLSKISKIVIIFILGLTLFQSLGFNISSILAFGGIGGLVVGMAAKDMLSNIFGGIMVNLDKSFSIGDWIRVNNIEGTVEHIGWRTTRIRTFSKNPVYVPNSLFSTTSIETPSRMTNRRIKELIGLRYNDITKVKDIMRDIESMLNKHKNIDKKALTMVYFETFNDSSLDIIVYTFTETTNWYEYQNVKSDILLDIYNIIEMHGADIAYPTQTVNIQKN